MKDIMGLEFFGINTEYVDVNKRKRKRIYFDSAASSLAMKKPYHYRENMMGKYANLHTRSTNSAKFCTNEFTLAKKEIIDYFGFNEDEYVCVFNGSGSTSCINNFSRLMSQRFSDKSKVLLSLMEHHSNDLPHRRWANEVIHIELEESNHCINLFELEKKLAKEDICYVAVTALSNVTGIATPINEIATLVHKYGTYLLVDASQSCAHIAPPKTNCADAWIFPGHKMYAPGTPGVMIINKSLYMEFEPAELGGGIVSDVSKYSYSLSENIQDKLQAGTPDFLGAVQISQVLREFRRVGFEKIEKHEQQLAIQFVKGLRNISNDIYIYGLNKNNESGCGIISFNIKDVDHGLVTAILNDFYCIEVRSGCFCAHPYVRHLLRPLFLSLDIDDFDSESINKKLGMVRVSFGIYNTKEDVDYLLSSIRDIYLNIGSYRNKYMVVAKNEPEQVEQV